jgi:hypothetical protein
MSNLSASVARKTYKGFCEDVKLFLDFGEYLDLCISLGRYASDKEAFWYGYEDCNADCWPIDFQSIENYCLDNDVQLFGLG